MRILQLTPGTGNFYCGACMRDNALVRGLRARGHDVLMVPLYLPLVTDDEPASADVPIFLSGLSVYFGNKFSVPAWLNRVLSSPALLRQAAKLASLTRANDLGEAAVDMLRGESREVERLLAWLRTQPPFDVVCLSNALLAGLAHHFTTPVVSTLQGEDGFLDGLPEPYRQQAWDLLAQRCVDIQKFIAVSQAFGDRMRDRLRLPSARVAIAYPGIAVENLPVAEPTAPVIGYLARMHPCKGLDLLAEAFLQVKTPGARLHIAGAMTGADQKFVQSIRQKLGDRAEFFPNLNRAAKSDFFRQLSVFSVPARNDEAFGMYVLEAMAHGVPVVQPRHGAFPEIIDATGGGILCEPNNPVALAAGLDELLVNPQQYGAAGRQAVRAEFSIEAMTQKTEEILQQVIHAA